MSGDNPGNAFFKKSLCKQEDCRKIDKNMFVSSQIFGKVNQTYNNSRGTETSSWLKAVCMFSLSLPPVAATAHNHKTMLLFSLTKKEKKKLGSFILSKVFLNLRLYEPVTHTDSYSWLLPVVCQLTERSLLIGPWGTCCRVPAGPHCGWEDGSLLKEDYVAAGRDSLSLCMFA